MYTAAANRHPWQSATYARKYRHWRAYCRRLRQVRELLATAADTTADEGGR